MFLLSTSFVLAALGVVSARRSLEVETLGSSVVNGVDNFAVTTKVKNTGDETLKLFGNPQSVLSKFPENSFTVTTPDGGSTEFVGARAKYGFNQETEFVTLAPGESKEVTHNLGNAYKFTTDGDYTIEASNTFYYADESGNPVPIVADSPGGLSAKLEGSLTSRSIANRRAMSVHRRAEWANCSVEQQGLIELALNQTTYYLLDSIAYLSNLTDATPRYQEWFGNYSATRHETVLDHYTKINTTDPNTYTYDCSFVGCRSGVYAYVYPDTFGVIHLCDSFWRAPINGTDSKAGTIIHEASHFTDNGGTDDHAYGQTRCRALARSNPDTAVMNADSHEYFAENTPTLD